MKNIYITFLNALFMIGTNPFTYSQVGSLDNTFGIGGITITDFGSTFNEIYDIAIQVDGKIVVVGRTRTGINYDFAAARYNPDGSLDNTFNATGIVVTSVSPSADGGRSVIIQPDGKIIVGGYCSTAISDKFALVRYLQNGTLDSTFGLNGITLEGIGISCQFSDMDLQPDGKIVSVGYKDTIGTQQIVLIRCNGNGSLDNSFDEDGKVLSSIGLDQITAGNSIKLQSDGKILVAGLTYQNTDFELVLLRYKMDGSLDSTFDFDGVVNTDFADSTDRGASIAIQSDDKILVAGMSYQILDNDFAIARYNMDGSLDSTFNLDGKVTTDFGSDDRGRSIIIQPNGKILVAGSSNTLTNEVFALARYNIDGSLDNSLDTDGKMFTAIGGLGNSGRTMALQADGKILIAGFSNNGSDYDFVVARYNNDLVGIEDMNSTHLNVFPNPVKGFLNLSLEKGITNASFKLINEFGQIVLQKENLNGNSFSFDVSEYMTGVYFVIIKEGNEFFTQKIIKQ